MVYSSAAEILNFSNNLGRNPLFVCDMDGNLYKGYALTSEHKDYFKNANIETPEKQDIPFDLSLEELDTLVHRGILEERLFVDKSMDVRISADLVDFLNAQIEQKNPLGITFLTSREASEALTILKASGVEKPEQLTLVADSGAVMYDKGEHITVRALSEEEKGFLKSIETHALEEWQEGVQQILAEMGFDERQCPKFYLEQKNIAMNVHYRGILNAYSQPEGSELDERIGAFIKDKMDALNQSGPKDEAGQDAFKVLDGPATVEAKLIAIHKGHGLEAIVAKKLEEGAIPSSVSFSGDDVSKPAGPGTDYYAMILKNTLAEKFSIPFYNIHILHPLNGLNDNKPNMTKHFTNLAAGHPRPEIDLTLRTPEENTAFMLHVFDERARLLPLDVDLGVDAPSLAWQTGTLRPVKP